METGSVNIFTSLRVCYTRNTFLYLLKHSFIENVLFLSERFTKINKIIPVSIYVRQKIFMCSEI